MAIMAKRQRNGKWLAAWQCFKKRSGMTVQLWPLDTITTLAPNLSGRQGLSDDQRYPRMNHGMPKDLCVHQSLEASKMELKESIEPTCLRKFETPEVCLWPCLTPSVSAQLGEITAKGMSDFRSAPRSTSHPLFQLSTHRLCFR